MLKRDAMALTLKEGTKVRKSAWPPNQFAYYCQSDGKVRWADDDVYSEMNCNLEEDGWEIYRQPIVAKGLVELFSKHTALGKDSLDWRTPSGLIVRTLSLGVSTVGLVNPDTLSPHQLTSYWLNETFTLV